MKIKTKVYIVILISFVIGVAGFTFLTQTLGHHYYIHRKKDFLIRQAEFIEAGNTETRVESVVYYEVKLNTHIGEFNRDIKLSLFKEKNAWKYKIWFTPSDIEKLKKKGSVSRIFYQDKFNLAFLVMLKKINGEYYVIKTNIPSIKVNFNFARELNILVMMWILGFQSVLLVIFSKLYSRKIESIKKNLNLIKERKFDEIKGIEGESELEEISELIGEVAIETREHLEYVENLAREQKDFLRTFGHEIKTPLTIAHGYTEMLIKKDPENEYIETISKELVRVSKITRKFQEYSAGEKELFLEKTLIDEFIEIGDVISASNPKIHYRCEEMSGEIGIECDIELTEGIFYNLFSNAFRYCRESVWCRVEEVEGMVVIEIENDLKTPLDDEELKKMWKPFYRSGNHSDSTGLGLSIVKETIKNHKWNIVGIAKEGGVVFKIEIPLNKV